MTFAPRKLAIALTLAVAGAAGIVALALPAVDSQAATTTLCNSQTLAASGGAYTIQNNEWGSSAPECISTDGNADFTVANSSISNSTSGAPGGYPSIYKGCHWGACTSGSGFPIQVSALHDGHGRRQAGARASRAAATPMTWPTTSGSTRPPPPPGSRTGPS